MLRRLMPGLLLATGAFAQSSILGAIATYNPGGTALNNQQRQADIATTKAAAEEARARAERIRVEIERIRLETLRESQRAEQAAAESQRAQQAAADSKRSAELEAKAKSLETELAEARRQMRIEHLKVLALEVREKHSDFDETITRLNCPLSQAMDEAILDSESAAEIIYWLGKHATECRLIADLHPLSAAREIGRIEGTIAPLQK